MVGTLLISARKNGRFVKTYGVEKLKIYNMKLRFTCLVIVLWFSVCASGELEIYPGLKLLSQQRHRFENSEESPLSNLNEWQIQKYQDDLESPSYDYELQERLRQFEDLLQQSKNRPTYEDDDYSQLEKGKDFEGYEYKLPSRSEQILEDVRPYAEDDFSFGEDEVDEQLVSKPAAKSNIEDAPKADPSEFAYPPSDPRFFQTTYSDKNAIKTKLPSLEEQEQNRIELAHRSDEMFAENSNSAAALEMTKNTDRIDIVAVKPQVATGEATGLYIIAVVAGISAAATVALIAVGIGWYNLQKHVKSASDVEYPAYGVTGPNKDASPSSDRRLAQSAQMYHYQHQKQQIIAMESRAAAGERQGSVSEGDSEEENEEGDYTVYECPGLAPTGEMEVKNPLFQDDTTPAQTPKPNENEKK